MDAHALTCQGCGGPAAAVECMDSRGIVWFLICRFCGGDEVRRRVAFAEAVIEAAGRFMEAASRLGSSGVVAVVRFDGNSPYRAGLRALSVRQPWAYGITDLGKDVENRSWRSAPSYRGALLIHAASRCTLEEYEQACQWITASGLARPQAIPFRSDLTFGAYVAVADLVHASRFVEQKSRWAIDGECHLVLANVAKLSRPIHAKGKLGLYVPDYEDAREAERQTGRILVARP